MATIVEDNLSYAADSVRRRISWAAILAGAAVAMAIYALLMSLGVAVGMSVVMTPTAVTLAPAQEFGALPVPS